MSTDKSRQYGLWDDVDRAIAVDAAVAQIIQEHAAASAAAAWEIMSAGYAPTETLRQLESLRIDENTNLIRAVDACRA